MEATRVALDYDGGPEAAATIEVLEKVRQGLSTVGNWDRSPRTTDMLMTSYSVWNMEEIMVSVGLQSQCLSALRADNNVSAINCSMNLA